MHPLHSIAAIRAAEQAALAALPPGTLMARAASASAAYARKLLNDASGPILVLAGPGNNGGDALLCAAELAAAHPVSIFFIGDAAALPADAARAYAQARASAAIWLAALPAQSAWALVIDGLFGIGLTRPLQGAALAAVDYTAELRCPVLALDVPSGLHAETGQPIGGGSAVRATHTITFIGDKPGLHTGAGRDHAGQVELATLGVAPAGEAQLRLSQMADFAHCLRPRAHASHKGTYGDVAIAGGADGMGGAVLLAARTAAMCGAGRVYAGFLGSAPALDYQHPELMCRDVRTLDVTRAAVVAGPGLSTAAPAAALLTRLVQTPGPLVLDADALNLLASQPILRQAASARKGATLLTPHPLEAARLLESTVEAIQADRVGSARALAARLHAVVILKGSGSVIA
ncbi:MAG TPA: NAD(P)H-hydrate epimerase, partial [Burkholderiaceae bacterium]